MTATAFSLPDLAGEPRRFPTERPSLICFVKEDCATCNLAAPVLEAFHKAWGEVADIWMVGQTADGNEILKDRHGLTLPILDDSALRTSLAWGFEIVPAVYWIGPEGEPAAPLAGHGEPGVSLRCDSVLAPQRLCMSGGRQHSRQDTGE